jgi:3-oxoacyl-[acyl-carrier protein] reductase
MDHGDRPVVLVTGGTGDLGSAIAGRFAAGGYRTALSFLGNVDKAERIRDRLHRSGGDVLTVKGDVASDSDCRRIVSEVVSAWGRLDTLVNNAADTKFVPHDDLDGLDASDFQATFGITVIGAYQMVRAAVPYLRQAGRGSVVNISSVSALNGTGSSMAYAASKAALNNLTLALARSLAPEIRVNALCPAFIESSWLAARLGADRYQRAKSTVEAEAPLARVTSPAEVADTAFWLAHHAGYATGEVLRMDGGLHLGAGPLASRRTSHRVES